MVSTDDFTSQYRCGCHRPPSCQEVCGPGVKNRISWFMDLHGWPRHLDALNARLHARQAGPTWITAVFQRRKRLDLKVFSGTPPCKDQWVKNSAGERFCETMIELCNYDIWDKESLCADGSCSTRGGGPTYSIELIYECRKWFTDVFVYRQAYHPMSWIQPGANANFLVLIRTSLIVGLYMAGEQQIELVPLRSVLPRHILTFLPLPRSLNCKPCCWSNHPLWWVVCSSHSRNCTMKCWMVVGFLPFEPKSFRLRNLSFKVSGLILKGMIYIVMNVDTRSCKCFLGLFMIFV